MDANQIICELNSMDSATAASWVQAFGSIAALAVAILVSYLQHRNDRNNENIKSKEKVLRSLGVAISLSHGVVAKLKVLKGWAISSNPSQHAVNIDFLQAEVNSLKTDLIAIDLNDIDNFEVLKTISVFKTFANLSYSIIEEVASVITSQLHWNQIALIELNRMFPEFEDEMKFAKTLEENLKKELKQIK